MENQDQTNKSPYTQQQFKFSKKTPEDPMLPVGVNGATDILVDSGALISSVRASESVCSPAS